MLIVVSSPGAVNGSSSSVVTSAGTGSGTQPLVMTGGADPDVLTLTPRLPAASAAGTIEPPEPLARRQLVGGPNENGCPSTVRSRSTTVPEQLATGRRATVTPVTVHPSVHGTDAENWPERVARRDDGQVRDAHRCRRAPGAGARA